MNVIDQRLNVTVQSGLNDIDALSRKVENVQDKLTKIWPSLSVKEQGQIFLPQYPQMSERIDRTCGESVNLQSPPSQLSDGTTGDRIVMTEPAVSSEDRQTESHQDEGC